MVTRRTIKNRLRQIYNLIENGWCKGTSARNKYGRTVSYKSKSAVEFCLSGAYGRVTMRSKPETTSIVREAIRDEIELTYGNRGMVRFNDSRESNKAVLRLLKRCIEAI